MADFDSIINTIIPWIIAIVMLYLLYRPLKEPLAPLFEGIGNFFSTIKRKITGEGIDEELFERTKTLEYE